MGRFKSSRSSSYYARPTFGSSLATGAGLGMGAGLGSAAVHSMLGHRPYGYYNDGYYGQPYHHQNHPGNCYTSASNNVSASAPYPYGPISGPESLTMAPYYFPHHIEVHEVTRYEKPRKSNLEESPQNLQQSEIKQTSAAPPSGKVASSQELQKEPIACSSELKNFMDCANKENSNLSLCTAFNDIYLACKKNVSSLVEEKN